MYKVSFYKQVVKYYTKLDSKTQKRINIAVDEIMNHNMLMENGVDVGEIRLK